jgi:hypothetical protein
VPPLRAHAAAPRARERRGRLRALCETSCPAASASMLSFPCASAQSERRRWEPPLMSPGRACKLCPRHETPQKGVPLARRQTPVFAFVDKVDRPPPLGF